jgi:hypothetical protein
MTAIEGEVPPLVPNSWGLCEGCPPAQYPSHRTRCLPCPRRVPRLVNSTERGTIVDEVA